MARPSCLEQRTRGLQRLRERALAQLDDVAEQHQPVGARDRLGQRLERLSLARDIGGGQDAEVKVGDDGRPHPPHSVT